MPDFLSLRSKQCNLLCLPFQKCQEILTLFQNLSKVSRIRDTSFRVGGAPIKVCNSLINDVITFTAKEDFAVKAIIRNPKVLAAELAELTGVKQRQAQRIIAALKQKLDMAFSLERILFTRAPSSHVMTSWLRQLASTVTR